MDQRDRCARLASARRHRHEQLPLTSTDRILDRADRPHLVVAELEGFLHDVGRLGGEASLRDRGVLRAHRDQHLWRVPAGESARMVGRIANIEEPHAALGLYLAQVGSAVRRVEERHDVACVRGLGGLRARPAPGHATTFARMRRLGLRHDIGEAARVALGLL